jgi:DNA polymerase
MDSLSEIAEKIKNCRRCELWKSNTNYVPGEGNENSKIVFIGEAPGREEDVQGKPFVGNAGKLLTEMISKKLKLSRDDVFITNVLKCRPPKNRDPLPEEVEKCKPYLIEQLKLLKPKVIVCLGRHSAKLIFELFGMEFNGISSIRGKFFEIKTEWGDSKVVAVYHPAAVLYRPQLREVLERDFEKISSAINLKNTRRGMRTLNEYFDL